ncbi:ATP-binding cassette domain-containing protein [Streptomyces sp. FXJ1.4098]|nr:ATP-binding cassette domain-containing protein [Streptomyces sp. FXJ1.4098]
MPTQITALAVSKSFNGRLVLDSVTCSLAAGERTGIIGENGSGKTTLLRLLAGRERPDQGEVVVQATGGVGCLAQNERMEPQATVQQIIDRALTELRTIEQRMRRLEAAMADGDESGMAEYGELMTVFELRGGYDADARVERALHGLGLGWWAVTVPWAACPAESGSDCGWPPCWQPRRRCCCWTSRPTISTTPP